MAQAGEVAQVHELGLLGMLGGEPVQRVVQRQQLVRRLRDGEVEAVEVDAVQRAAALDPPAPAGRIDEDPPHRFGRGGEKMPAAVPHLHLGRVDEAQVRLVHEGRRLERLVGPLLADLAGGERAQLLVHQRQQVRRRAGVARPRLVKQRGHRRRHGYRVALIVQYCHVSTRPSGSEPRTKQAHAMLRTSATASHGNGGMPPLLGECAVGRPDDVRKNRRGRELAQRLPPRFFLAVRIDCAIILLSCSPSSSSSARRCSGRSSARTMMRSHTQDLAEFLQHNRELVHEIGRALGRSRFRVVWRWRGAAAHELGRRCGGRGGCRGARRRPFPRGRRDR